MAPLAKAQDDLPAPAGGGVPEGQPVNTPDPLAPAQPAPGPEPLPVTAGAAPYWASPQFKGLLVTFGVAVCKMIADLIGHWFPRAAAWLMSVTSEQLLIIVNDISSVALAGGVLWALRQRKRSKLQPLTFTKKAAAEAPETIAVVKTQQAMQAVGIPTAVELLQTTVQAAKDAAPLDKPTETKL